MVHQLIRCIPNVDIELTYHCNLRCVHCYNPDHVTAGTLSTGKVMSLIDEIVDVGFNEAHFNGGEPLLRKDITEILRYSSDSGLRTLLETNATLLSPDRFKGIERLVIRASVDGSELMHNTIRRTTTPMNAYVTTMENLAAAADYGIPVQVTCSVNAINCGSVKNLVADRARYGLKDVRLRLSMPGGCAQSTWGLLKLVPEQLETLHRDVERAVREVPSVKVDYATIVRAAPDLEPRFFVDPLGRVKPYPFIECYAGNVHTEQLSGILDKIEGMEYPREENERMSNYLAELGMHTNVTA